MSPLPFYVYVISDPRSEPPTPIYVGKGRGKRVLDHFTPSRRSNARLRQTIAEIEAAQRKAPYKIVARFEDEQAALDYEATLIKKYGRLNLGEGPLHNLSEGGHGLRRLSAEQLETLRQNALRLYADPAFRSRNLAAIKRVCANPVYMARARETYRKNRAAKRNTDPLLS